MACSLDKLASFLPEMPILTKEFEKTYSADQINLLRRKGVFPYDYVSSLEVLTETELLKRESFYSALNDCHVLTEDYQHACRVWDNLQIGTMGDYSDIYLKTDVFLLADVFEDYRELDRRTYGIDPGHYFGTADV